MITKETEKYWITFKYNPKKERYELVIKSRIGAGHFGVHTKYNILNDDGTLIETRRITKDVAEFIIERFIVKGDTESFNIFERELNDGRISSNHIDISPENVRHQLTNQEQSFTATGAKLYYHWPIFKKMAETGHGSIIRATMTNHQLCSSHCPYCSTISRNKKDSVTMDEAKAFVENLYYGQSRFNRENFTAYNDLYYKQTGSDIRLKGLILSGGGQPNLWPHFAEFVEWLSTLDIDLGLITNGFPQKVPEEIYKNFRWIRISVTPEDASPFYINGKFDQQYIPDSIKQNPNITIGFSYVYGHWTDNDILQRLNEACEVWGFNYCRLLTDCNLTRSSQLFAHKELSERLFQLCFIDVDGKPLKKLFHQLKFHGKFDEAETLWDKGQCFLQVYNVFWDTTGHEDNGYSFCYPCDSITVLAEEKTNGVINASERRFNSEKWGTVKNTEVEKLYTEPVRTFFDPRQICSACLFMRNNTVVKELMKCNNYSKLIVPSNIEHLNFP